MTPARWLVLARFAAVLALGAAQPAAATPQLTLGARLRAAGRAECGFTRVATDAFNGRPLQTRGRLTLEIPDRSRLEFPATGERITRRGDGGEWLQPKLHQLIVFGVGRAAGVRRWWQLLIDGAAPGIEVTPHGRRALALHASDGSGPDSARLELDATGLPARLVVPDGGTIVEYRFGRWSFGPGRGVAAYRQRAPAAYERVELP